MRRRCHDPTWPQFYNYGGRGIRVCRRWRNDFSAFIADVGLKPSRKHTLDRIDNDKDYKPGNVRWALWTQQCRNMRKNVTLKAHGVTATLAEWSVRTGIKETTLRYRYRQGWSARRVLSIDGTRGLRFNLLLRGGTRITDPRRY